MEQFDPAASVEPHAFEPVVMAKSLGFAPVMLGTMLLSVALPVLERVAASAADVVPTGVLGKLSEEVSEAAGPVLEFVNPVVTPKNVDGLLWLL